LLGKLSSARDLARFVAVTNVTDDDHAGRMITARDSANWARSDPSDTAKAAAAPLAVTIPFRVFP